MIKLFRENRIILVGTTNALIFLIANYSIHQYHDARPDSVVVHSWYLWYEFAVPFLVAIGILVLSLYAQAWVHKAHAAEDLSKDLERQNEALVLAASTHVPICARCKMIRTSDDNWQPVEAYLSARIDEQLTHGLCPDCAKYYQDLAALDQAR